MQSKRAHAHAQSAKLPTFLINQIYIKTRTHTHQVRRQTVAMYERSHKTVNTETPCQTNSKSLGARVFLGAGVQST